METADYQSVAELYGELWRSGKIERDPAQESLARDFDRVLSAVRDVRVSSKSSALGWLFASRRKPEPVIKGLYVYGAVGRGKTMLMDLFHRAVPAKRKRRVHFHDFMADVHGRIHAHRQAYKAGKVKEEDPIPPVAKEIGDEAWVLCFDEFSVTDITDAMILSRLFTQLFKRGCVLVATSNVAPENLYKDGLNRQLFLPFLDLLADHVETVNLDARTDYRHEKTDRLPVYLEPLNARTQALFEKAWRDAIDGQKPESTMIERQGRSIEVPKSVEGIARFTFADLCEAPLGAADYAAIARRFPVLFLSDVPVMGENRRNAAKRFINLIDTLYDVKAHLTLSAAAPPGSLYTGERGNERFEFERTASRLIEMQSADYISASAGDTAAEDRKTAGSLRLRKPKTI